MNRYRVFHHTTYDYSQPVAGSYHYAHVVPRPGPFQKVISSTLSINPPALHHEWYTDFHGNRVDEIQLLRPHRHFSLSVESEVAVDWPRFPQDNDPAMQQPWGHWAATCAALPAAERQPLRDFLRPSKSTPQPPQLRQWVDSVITPKQGLLATVNTLNSRIFSDFTYRPGVTDIHTPLIEVLEHRHGVCQDFAHLLVAALRLLGLPARYVSGYLETIPPPGGQRLIGADASHAWASVYLPAVGWIDLDPTNDLLVGNRHITLAWGRDYHDVTPLKGIIHGGGDHQIKVAVDVQLIAEE